MFRKKLRNFHDDLEYYYEAERRDDCYNKTLYEHAIRLEDETIFDICFLDTKGKLDHLVEEIKVRIKITKQEIFKIGELLVMAKKICQEEGSEFQDWIKDNFDFSYETAHNFMNVFEQCLGYRDIAFQVPVSILYKLSTPSFPKELKDYLFLQGNLEKMTNGKLKGLIDRYKKGGIKAVSKDMDKLNRGHLIYRQTQYTFDMCENTLRALKELLLKIDSLGKNKKSYLSIHEKVQFQQPEAGNINMRLVLAIEGAITDMEEAVNKSRKELSQFKKEIFGEM